MILKIKKQLALVLSLTLGLNVLVPLPAHSPITTPDAYASIFPEFEKIMDTCKDVMKKNGDAKDSVKKNNSHGKYEHCKAAYDAHLAKVYQMVSTAMWSGLAAFCTVACAVQYYAPYMADACNYSSMGTGVQEMVMSMALQTTYQHSNKAVEQIIAGVSGVAGLAQMAGLNTTIQTGQNAQLAAEGHANIARGQQTMAQGASQQNGQLMNAGGEQMAKGADQVKQAQGGQFNVMVCVTAAMATAQAVIKGLSFKEIDGAIEKSVKNAKKWEGQKLPSALPPKLAKNNTGDESPSRDFMGVGNTVGQYAEEEKLDTQGQCGMNSNSEALMSCAVAYDKSTPPFLSDKKFSDDFNKATGVNLGDLTKASLGGASPTQMMSAALASKFGDAKTIENKYSDLVSHVQQMQPSAPGSTYVGGGGSGGKSKGKGLAGEMGDFMSQFMNQLKPKEEQKLSSGVSELEFKLNNLPPEQIMENRSISLFDRVTYRYYKNRPQLDQLPYASPYNRSIAGGAGSDAKN